MARIGSIFRSPFSLLFARSRKDELIAEYIVHYANLVGRENVIAGADCGFSSRASYAPEVHATVVWPKFRALAEGAALATKQLWP